VQPQVPTIQGTLEAALAAALGHPVSATAGGRTDSGVHAIGQVVSLQTTSALDVDAVRRATNARLPHDVLVRAVVEAPNGFDARRWACWRRYRYTIWREPTPNIWWQRYSAHLAVPLDLAAMRRASRALLGRRDFAAFATHQGQANRPEDTERTIHEVRWQRAGGFWHFEIVADAFLRHMVRTIVGTLVLVGRGQMRPAEVGTILQQRDRRRAGPTMPAHGLTLMEIAYRPGLVAGETEGEAGDYVLPAQGRPHA
jgi:tRNA pseudouridine38-40 synthase